MSSLAALSIIKEIANEFDPYYISAERLVAKNGVIWISATRMDRKRDEILDKLQERFFFDRSALRAYFYEDRQKHFYIRDAYFESDMIPFLETFKEIPVFLSVDGLHTHVPMFMSRANFDFWQCYGYANFDCAAADSLYVEQGEYGRVFLPVRLNRALKK